jgi:hypothetical protein
MNSYVSVDIVSPSGNLVFRSNRAPEPKDLALREIPLDRWTWILLEGIARKAGSLHKNEARRVGELIELLAWRLYMHGDVMTPVLPNFDQFVNKEEGKRRFLPLGAYRKAIERRVSKTINGYRIDNPKKEVLYLSYRNQEALNTYAKKFGVTKDEALNAILDGALNEATIHEGDNNDA